ncbi:DNA/RNA polymerases superfamily protein [Gossypium australe]|uniref:DNA/RNA polymerases superfamily protein n=1 Tax=Gossypium australe TaxID=47621 RepID=A0A5B6WIX5_9ROSI|nr:DNA/RNA polymerases superfamily protein [Gossypium australe]
MKLARTDLICSRPKKKSYADLERKDIEFEIGDKIFLKVSPWKNVLHFSRKGKLNLRFIEPYEILERTGLVAYRLALPLEPNRYRSDPSHVLTLDEIESKLDLMYDEKLVKILAHEIKELKIKAWH